MSDPIIIYTSSFCFHSRRVQRFFERKSLPVKFINIDGNQEARQRLMELNRGYASVPTLLFPDGTQLTEPSIGEIKSKLGIDNPGIIENFKKLVGK